MSLAESEDARVRKIIDGIKCSCGNDKKVGHSFCMRCYSKLPENLRMNLYKSFSEDFVGAYWEAELFLRTV